MIGIDGPGRHRGVIIDAATEAQPLIADWGLALLAVTAGVLFVAAAIGWMVETYRRSSAEGEATRLRRATARERVDANEMLRRAVERAEVAEADAAYWRDRAHTAEAGEVQP